MRAPGTLLAPARNLIWPEFGGETGHSDDAERAKESHGARLRIDLDPGVWVPLLADGDPD